MTNSMAGVTSPCGTLFFNRSSGSFDAARLEALRSRLGEAGIELEEIERGRTDIAGRIREKLGRGQTLFIAAGGDGTIHHAAQALVQTDAVLAVLPVGTFNHLARDIGIPLDWDAALDVALGNSIHEIDVGVVNGRYFLNNMILGIYPDVVREREKLRQHHSKWRAYLKATRLAFKRFRHVSVTIESAERMELVKTHVFAVSVNRYDLNTLGVVAPKTSFTDGRLSVYWLPYTTKLRFIRTLARYLRGSMRHGDELRTLSTLAVKVQSSKSHVRSGIDGELVELQMPLRVSIVPRGIRMKVPAEFANGPLA